MENYSFPQSARLLKAIEYSQVFEQPLKSVDDCFTILWRKNSLDYPRLGLAISKKNAKRAVDRNRIKRLARESFRLETNRLPSVDIVILSRRQTIERSNYRIFRSLNKHWEKIIRHG